MAKLPYRYWRDTYLDALNDVKKVLEPLKIDIMEASLRWLKHHSKLDGNKGDGYIVGGSNG